MDTADGAGSAKAEQPTQPLLPRRRNLSPERAMFNLMKSMLGTGMLGLPYAFKLVGLYGGLLGLAVTTFLCTLAQRNIVAAAEHFETRAAGSELQIDEMVEMAVRRGPKATQRTANWARRSFAFTLIMSNIATCSTYLLFIAANAQHVSNHLLGVSISIYVWLSLLLIPALCLALFVRDLRTAAPLSLACTVPYLAAVLVTVQYLLYEHRPSSSLPAFGSAANWPRFVAMVVFSFESVTVVLPIRNRCVDRRHYMAPLGVLNATCALVACVYAAVAYFGYLKAGPDVRETIALNFPTDVWLYQITQLLFAVSLFGSFVMQMYTPMEMVETHIMHRCFVAAHGRQMAACYAARTAAVLVVYAIAVVVPHLDLVVSLSGASMAIVGMTAPGPDCSYCSPATIDRRRSACLRGCTARSWSFSACSFSCPPQSCRLLIWSRGGIKTTYKVFNVQTVIVREQ